MLVLLVCIGAHSGCTQTRLAPVENKQTSRPLKTPASYRVRSGDTLFSIAFQHGYDYQEVASWNRIRPPYTIYVGQVISLRPGGDKKVTKPQPVIRPATTVRNTTSPPQIKKTEEVAKIDETTEVEPTDEQQRPIASNPPAIATDLAWRWPTTGKIVERYSAGNTGRNGIDIAGQPGQQIQAAEAGTVVYAGSGLLGYGKLIIIKHNDIFLSAYAHNRLLLVKEGEQVSAGQKIAEMGDSGTDSTKLHFEIRRNGRPVNPQDYLPG